METYWQEQGRIFDIQKYSIHDGLGDVYKRQSLYYQIKLPLDVEILIPADAPVRLPV